MCVHACVVYARYSMKDHVSMCTCVCGICSALQEGQGHFHGYPQVDVIENVM